MASDKLFSINADKNDKKREKLKADRFKEHVQKHTSTTEKILVKRLREKGPVQHQKDPDAEEMDVWGTPAVKAPIFAKFESFRNGQMAKVKAVMAPLGGQSFNPSA